MRVPLLLSIAAASVLSVFTVSASAQDRYRERPPVVVSPDLSAPWVMQLGRQHQVRQNSFYSAPRATAPRATAPGVTAPGRQQQRRQVRVRDGYYELRNGQFVPASAVQAAAPRPREVRRQMDPMYLPRAVDFPTNEKPGTIVIDTANKFLYFVEGNGQATRYGIGVGKDGMSWTGVEYVTNKREWPNWHPPAEMRARELREKGRVLPVMMKGGPENPLGARALYLGQTLYRIHGTNAPWTIGTNNSSGCFRMRNEDAIQLYERVKIGAKVVVQ